MSAELLPLALAHVLADKVGAYADCYARRVNDPALPGSPFPRRRTDVDDQGTVAHWTTFYPRTGLTDCRRRTCSPGPLLSVISRAAAAFAGSLAFACAAAVAVSAVIR